MRAFGSALVVSLLLLTSCSGAAATKAGSPRVIAVQIREFGYSPTSITLRANEVVKLELRNTGTLEHEVQTGENAQPGRGFATDALAGVDVLVDGASRAAGSDGHAGHDHGQFMLAVGPGKTASATFTVPSRPGTYEFGCFIPGHYEGGMKGSLIIQ
jgi:uncharacterized cupredoxin-like copper-binding protein